VTPPEPAPDDLPRLNIAMSVEPSGARMALSGDLEYATVGDFEGAMARMASDHPASDLTVDLQHLDFLDSSGVGALISASSAAGLRGVTLRCIRGSQNIQRPLEVAGVDRILEFSDPPDS